jgi:hypothetical protein
MDIISKRFIFSQLTNVVEKGRGLILNPSLVIISQGALEKNLILMMMNPAPKNVILSNPKN